MKCIVSGGTGFVGRHVIARLLRDGHQAEAWGRKSGRPLEEAINGAQAIVHLAGEPVAQRWNAEVKRRIGESRVLGTRRLVEAIAGSRNKPRVLVSASAIGYYGERGDEVLTEESAPGSGFLADLCREWEAEADRAKQFGLRVAKLRIGFVLGNDGGALATMLPVFRAGFGGRLGSGEQWMPWIHVDDLAELFATAVAQQVDGVWNATAPNPVTNAEFTREMGRALRRPAVLPVPAFALKLVFGEFAQHMLDSARVVPKRAEQAGFAFLFPEVGAALRNLLTRPV